MLLEETAEKIRTMEVRGAGRIARAAVTALASYGETLQARDLSEFMKGMERAAQMLENTRPTAVSLPNALHYVMRGVRAASSVEEARGVLARRTESFVEESNGAVRRIGEIGSRHIPDGSVVMTHCNSEAALACILAAHEKGKDITVFATEVRPRNQGLLTIRALNDAGIATSYIVDSAARTFMNEVDLVVVGADAVTANGAVINKIGTAPIALAAHEARTNFVVAAETYKFAPRTVLGELIEIEERGSAEVLDPAVAATLPHVRIRNPAFDVTPPGYIDMIITEQGAIPPALAPFIIREHLGWDVSEFQKTFEINSRDLE